MKEFQDLINRFLQGFRAEGHTIEYEIKSVEFHKDKDDIDYVALRFEQVLPKLVLDEIRQMEYEVYHISRQEHHSSYFEVGFFRPDDKDGVSVPEDGTRNMYGGDNGE